MGSAFSTQVINVSSAPTAPAVVAQPQSAVAPAGGNATLSVTTSGTPAPNVQWQADDGSGSLTTGASTSWPRATTTYTNVNGLTSATVTFPVTAANNKIHYRAVITNGEGTVTTVPVTLTVNKKSATADDRTSLAIAAKAALAAISRCRQATEQMAKNLTQDLRRLKASSDVKAKLSAYIANSAQPGPVHAR